MFDLTSIDPVTWLVVFAAFFAGATTLVGRFWIWEKNRILGWMYVIGNLCFIGLATYEAQSDYDHAILGLEMLGLQLAANTFILAFSWFLYWIMDRARTFREYRRDKRFKKMHTAEAV